MNAPARRRAGALGAVAFVGGFAAAMWMYSAPSPATRKAARAIVIAAKIERAAEPAAAESTPSPSLAKAAHPTLLDALEGDDPLASAARVLAWLDAATVADLRAVAAEPRKFLNPWFTGFYAEFSAAYFTAIVERWFALDPDGALPALQQMHAEQAKKEPFALTSLLEAVARVRPELALEKLPVEFKNERLDSVTHSAWRALGERDANAARRFLDRYTDPKMRRAAEVAITEGVAAHDPLGAMALARQMDATGSIDEAALAAAERIGPGMVRQVFVAAEGRLDSVGQLPELLLRYPDLALEIKGSVKSVWAGQFQEEHQQAADRVPPEERARLLANYDILPAGARDDLATALASAWARTDPRAAADWALAHAKVEDRKDAANGAAQQVFLRWVNNDTGAALAWWRALPASPLREALGNEASTFIAEAGDLDTALALYHPPEEKGAETSRTRLAQFSWKSAGQSSGGNDGEIPAQLTQLLVERDPARAATWLAALPDTVSTNAATNALIRDWFPRDPETAARWVESLPPGARRDQALNAFIEKAAQQSPAGAAEWVATVSDPELRRQAALQVFWPWHRDDPATANAWMRQLDGVDPEWHAHFLRWVK